MKSQHCFMSLEQTWQIWRRAARNRWQTHTKYRINKNVFRFFLHFVPIVRTEKNSAYNEWLRCALIPSIAGPNLIAGIIFDGICLFFLSFRAPSTHRSNRVEYPRPLSDGITSRFIFFILQLFPSHHLRPPLLSSHQSKIKLNSINYLWKPTHT